MFGIKIPQLRQGDINIKIDIFINETEESVKMNPRMYSQKESTIQRQYFQKMVKEQLEILIKK